MIKMIFIKILYKIIFAMETCEMITWGIDEFNEWILSGCTPNYKVDRLVIYGCGLTSLPESIGNLRGLQVLQLDHNKLTSLPESIGNLTALWWLKANNNQLTALPESIGNTALVVLDLSNNQLTSLPESIWNLTDLRGLHIDGNQLTSLPDSIGNLRNLSRLSVENNQLTSLPDSITDLKRIEIVRVDFYFKDLITNPDMVEFVISKIISFSEEQGDTKPAMQS
jgi:Leucine-rich repeat (LRR) protein